MRFRERWTIGLTVLGLMLAGCGSFGGDDEAEDPGPRDVPAGAYITTASGLQYYDFVEGAGPTPQTGDLVTVHYTGWLADTGVKFDSSYDRGTPFSFRFKVDNLIQGWVEGMETMRPGGERQLVIPAELGYGTRGNGPIPPNATLIFEIEYLSVQ